METLKIPYNSALLFSMGDWLKEKARQGKTFQELKGNTASFEEGDPGRIFCVLVPDSLKAEKKMEEARWKKEQPYRFGLNLYSTNAKEPALPTLGEEELGDSIRRARRFGERPYVLLLFVLFLVLCAVVSYYGGRFTFFLQRDVNLALCIVIPFAAAFAIHKIHEIRKDLRAYRTLWEQDETLEETYAHLTLTKEMPLTGGGHDAAKKKWQKAALIVGGIVVVLGLLTLVRHRQGPLSKAKFEYFSLQELENVPVTDEVVEDYGNIFLCNGSFFIGKQRETRQSGRIELEKTAPDGEDETQEGGDSTGSQVSQEGSESVTVAMRTMEYTCLTSSLAHQLLIGRMRTQLSWNSLVNGEELVEEEWTQAFDEAYRAGYQSMQYLFLRKGNKVMTIFYLGDVNLVESGEKIVQYFNRK